MIRTLKEEIGEYDLCIVGAGPAGLTVATELAFSGLSICVLESGEEDEVKSSEGLKKVFTEELPIKDNSRERGLGGSTSTWGGLSAPLDKIDVERGWPISYEEVSKYLAETQRYKFPSMDVFLSSEKREDRLLKKIFAIVRPPFRYSSFRYLFERAGMDLYFGATATEFKSEESNGMRRVTEVVCKTAEGKEVRIRATRFVLSAGTIETVRLMLNSQAGTTTLGNEYNQVGAYFMNHPKGSAGVLCLNKPLSSVDDFLVSENSECKVYAGLRLNDQYQKETNLLNSYVQFDPLYTSFQRLTNKVFGILSSRFHIVISKLSARKIRLRWYADMEPRESNRITLSSEVDQYGKLLPLVSYSLSELDILTLKSLFNELKYFIDLNNIGILEGTAHEVVNAVKEDASHHIGGMRMGMDVFSSVTDLNCRLHSVENLYVAGGSIFPTAGCANPTMTIVALAIRLARHLSPNTTSAPTLSQSSSLKSAKEIIIIGSGRRVCEDVLPVLESLKDDFSIKKIFAKHAGVIYGRENIYKVLPLSTLDSNLAQQIKFVYVAVPTFALEKTLTEICSKIPLETTFIIDTPVILSKQSKTLLLGRKVYVAEDSAYLPWVDLLRKKLRTLSPYPIIKFTNSVYRYHGVALARALFGTIDSPAKVYFGVKWFNKLWFWVGKGGAVILEPRDYRCGTLEINGLPELQLIVKNKACLGCVLGEDKEILSHEESELVGEVVEEDTVVSKMLELKRVGLRRLLSRIRLGASSWTLSDGVQDANVDRIIHKYRVFMKL